MKKIIVAALLSMVSYQWSMAQVGTWNAYMAYHDVTEVEEAGNLLFVLASDNLYSYNRNDQSIQTYDKANALSDCDIAHIKYCASAKRLVIVYDNENIDLMDLGGNVTNLSDYYTASLTGDKTVNSIDIDGIYAYLSTGFGIIKVNVRNADISDTYNLGFNVSYSYIQNGNLYAASNTNGLYAGALADNLLDKSNWSRVGDYAARSTSVDPDLLALVNTLNPGGPKYNHFGFMKFMNGRLYTCGGGWSVFGDEERPGTIQVLDTDHWTIFQDDFEQTTGTKFVDNVSLDIDPKDASHLFAAGRTGLYEYQNEKLVKHYTYDNSVFPSLFNTDKNYVTTSSVKYDDSGNLWCLYSMGYDDTKNIYLYTTDEEWKSYLKSEIHDGSGNMNFLRHILFDSRKLMWFVNDDWERAALICYQPSTDALKVITTFINEDGSSVSVSGGVRCVTEDKDGNIWIGTNVGPLMLEPSQITADSPIFNQIKVPRNDGTNYADYLLDGVDVTCIAIDGGGRKWFGTNGNGVYLISEDNYTQIHHFLANNSNLLSDYVESIAINDQTGEVFFGTDKGLCSYMSDATATNEKMTKNNVWAYPNPVRPDYTGLITVTGLSYNADVKIVTSNGVLVTQGKSNGGMFTWDGCDLKGKRVASGVYMVEVATQEGSKGIVTKIAIVR